MEMNKVEVESMVSTIKKHRRDMAIILKAYKIKRFGSCTNEFGQKYSVNYLDGIVQALEFTLTTFGITKNQIKTREDIDFLYANLVKQGME